MNTPKTGMRTILAAAAAGALVLGSAAGVSAAPGKGNGPKAPGYMQVRMVNLYNAPVNVFSAETARTVKVQANVWDSVSGKAPLGLTVDIAEYVAKGQVKAGGILLDDVVLTTKASEGKKSKKYRGEIANLYDLLSVEQREAAKTAPILMCLASVDLDVPDAVKEADVRKQVTNKLGRDCFRVVNVDPMAAN